MRANPVVSLVLGLAVALTAWWSPQARADDKDEKVKFESVDGVELHGVWYPSADGKRAPAVLLLHKVTGKSDQDGWDKLAKELQQKAGCSVLSFDFRGHGNSTTVDPAVFWRLPYNRDGVKGFDLAKPKDSISFKDFSRSYYPELINDIVAAKLFLDKQNDLQACNSANTIVIGAEDGATLGLMWMVADQYLYRAINPNPLLAPIAWKFDSNPEGKDVACGLWLNLSPTLGSQGTPISSWLGVTKSKKIPMAFLYGAEDDSAAGRAKGWVSLLKPDKKQIFTTEKGIPKTKLAGSQLLGEKLETIPDIVNYVASFKKENQGNDYDKRDVEGSTFVWKFPTRILKAKDEKEKVIYPVPIADVMQLTH
jgi:hypothetical protein